MEQAPPAQQGGGGGVTEALVETDKNLAAIAAVMAKNPKVPDEVKAAFQAATESFRQGLAAVSEMAGGGQEPAPGGPGAVAPEAGGSAGAVPMTPAGVKRG